MLYLLSYYFNSNSI